MTVSTDTRFELLHAVRVKGLATDEVLAEMTGLDTEALASAAAPLVEEGVLLRREGRFSGYSLTPEGKQAAADALAEDAATAAARTDLAALDEDFLPVNGDFKRLCQRWQMRDGEPNDHQDAAYDAAVIDDLVVLDAAWRERLAAVAPASPRIARYAVRLDGALTRLRAGDNGAFARPMYNSYHDIWMELHEDLIVSLGRTRGSHDEG